MALSRFLKHFCTIKKARRTVHPQAINSMLLKSQSTILQALTNDSCKPYPYRDDRLFL